MRKLWVLGALILVGFGITAGSATAAGVTEFTVHLAPVAGAEPDASGVAVLRLDPATGEVCYSIVVRNVDQPTEPLPDIGSAHIHQVGAPAPGIVVDLDTVFLDTGTDTYIATGCATTDYDLALIIANPELYYINVHTTTFPGGQVQGSLAG